MIALQFDRQFGKSFVYMNNKRGPRTDPCGTSHDIVVVSDLILLYCAYCFYCQGSS